MTCTRSCSLLQLLLLLLLLLLDPAFGGWRIVLLLSHCITREVPSRRLDVLVLLLLLAAARSSRPCSTSATSPATSAPGSMGMATDSSPACSST
jgi:hypothetical protein